jgi:oligopeptidase B
VTAPIATPGKEHWKELVAARPDVPLEGVSVFARLLRAQRARARIEPLPRGAVRRRPVKTIQFPEPTYAARARTTRSSRPASSAMDISRWSRRLRSIDYDVKTKTSKLLKQNEVPGGFDRNNYTAERIEVPAPTASRSRSRSSIARDSSAKPIPSTSTATALTDIRWRRASARRACHWSIADSWWRSCTFAAAATSASPGTTPARC